MWNLDLKQAFHKIKEWDKEKMTEAHNIIGDRTDFKGQSMLPYRVASEDPMCDPKGNFFHHHWQN